MYVACMNVRIGEGRGHNNNTLALVIIEQVLWLLNRHACGEIFFADWPNVDERN